MKRCRACGEPAPEPVLDLGPVPVGDRFPLASAPVSPAESGRSLTMVLCHGCGLAQLLYDDLLDEYRPDEPRRMEPGALRAQAAEAVRAVAGAGLLRGDTLQEFGSPHGGTWLPLLTERGFRIATGEPADTVLDSFAMMHDPDQHGAIRERAEALTPDGVLFVQFWPLTAIVAEGRWDALQHGHFAYYSLTALRHVLGDAGLHVFHAWVFDLYGGTILVAARRDASVQPTPFLRRLIAAERTVGITSAQTLHTLQFAADRQAVAVRSMLRTMAEAGRRVYAYGDTSRAAVLFTRAGIDRTLVAAIADPRPRDPGRRMPGTDVPIVTARDLLDAAPDRVLLTLPDMLSGDSDTDPAARLPELEGRLLIPPRSMDDLDHSPWDR